ncbi:ribonuclease H-like domain-containing protein [Tanacetum coccineum]
MVDCKKNIVPRAVLMKFGLVSVNTARQVNAVHTKTIVNAARQMTKAVVNTAKPKAVVNAASPKAVVNAVKGNNVNAVKASACWVWKPKNKVLDHVSKHNSASITLKKFDYGNPQMDLQDKGVVDSGCSRHMIGNMSYLTGYKEIDGGYVAFGGNPKGGKITGKGTIKTGNLEFENVCDNKMSSKNRDDQFCERKGIKREFGVARTPQQNRVAERKNRTLIKAARTMLADSKLPTTFWAEAVNTACYKSSLGFMRPFGCPVTILNTIDHFGKFDSKANEGFFVGTSIKYSILEVIQQWN